MKKMLEEMIEVWQILSLRQKAQRVILASLALPLIMLAAHFGEWIVYVLSDATPTQFVSDNWLLLLSAQYAFLMLIILFISFKSKKW